MYYVYVHMFHEYACVHVNPHYFTLQVYINMDYGYVHVTMDHACRYNVRVHFVHNHRNVDRRCAHADSSSQTGMWMEHLLEPLISKTGVQSLTWLSRRLMVM